jgi:glycogen operon protein
MLTAGDEFLRTQRGNNNAWCQDNETSWVDWSLAETNKDFLRFVREMIRFRKRHVDLRRRGFFRGEMNKPEPIIIEPASGSDSGVLKRLAPKVPPVPQALQALADITWHGTEPAAPTFTPETREIAFTIDGRFTDREVDADLYVAINGSDMATAFLIPPSPQGKRWRRAIDTSLPSPNDIVDDEATGKLVAESSRYPVDAFSVVVLVTE